MNTKVSCIQKGIVTDMIVMDEIHVGHVNISMFSSNDVWISPLLSTET